MASPAELKQLASAVRPIFEALYEGTEDLKAFRESASGKGFDWSQLKALLKAQFLDEKDGGKRVDKLIEKADYAAAYADMLGLGKMNEKDASHSSSVPRTAPAEVDEGIPAFLDRRAS